MNSRNKLGINKFLIQEDECVDTNHKPNPRIIRTEGNNKQSPKMNKIRSKSNSRLSKNDLNSNKQNLSNLNKTKNILNQKISEIVKYTEDELGSLNSQEHIQSVVNMCQSFQYELINQLEQEYDENIIKKVLQSNFDKITKSLINYIKLYDNKCVSCILNLKKLLNNLLNTNIKIFSDFSQNNDESSLKVNTTKNRKFSGSSSCAKNVLSENTKNDFFKGEEEMVGLINSLSGGIKISNKNYRTSIIDMAKLIEESNNNIVELKNKLDKLNTQLQKITQQKKNINLFTDDIMADVENLYSMNINIIEDVKLLDTNQTSFYEEAKEIFNHLKINYNTKLREYRKLFDSIEILQQSQTNTTNSSQQITKKGKSITPNRSSNKKISENDLNDSEENIEDYNLNKKEINIKKRNANSQEKTKKNNMNIIKDKEKILNINNTNIDIYSLSNEVMEFFNKMKNLQDSIVKKKKGVNQMKVDFEKYKKKLIKLLQNIIDEKNNFPNKTNSYSKIINNNDNDIIALNNKNNTNKNSFKNIKTYSQLNNKIVSVEQFNIINENADNLFNGSMELNQPLNNSNHQTELKAKYDTLLEEVNTKSLEINNLQEKINKLTTENNDIKTKLKTLEKENQKLSSNEKKSKKNYNEYEKININEILSSSNNMNINSPTSNQELLEENNKKLQKENKNLKELINKCVNIIFESIKEMAPNMVEDNIISEESEEKDKNKNSENENDEEFDLNYITEAVKKFQSYNKEILQNIKKSEEEKEKFEKQAHENEVKANAYKNALEQAINKINMGDENPNFDINDKNQNKRQFTFDGEGEVSFKDNFGVKKNNKEDMISKNFGSNEEINKLIMDSNNEENQKKNVGNKNDDVDKINKDLLKVQKNLTEKIKYLEDEIEKYKLTLQNNFIEVGNEMYDNNENTISLAKYNRLVKLYEDELKKNKELESKYLSFINEINANIANKNNLSNKLNTSNKNKYEDENVLFENHEHDDQQKIINKNKTYGELNVHNENYLGLLNKDININGDEDDYENDENARVNRTNSGVYKNPRLQELEEENKNLEENENLLQTQLIAIKQELKETRQALEDCKKQNIELIQELEAQGTLKNENMIGVLRNSIERLITEIKITPKIKEILLVLLRVSSYTEEQIDVIFKYKEKKKNIINLFQLE